ncbi:lipoyl synthase [candidate division KSB1 bacterium]|nr:lipoyl synthase [candidate division KSB1 bacterium]
MKIRKKRHPHWLKVPMPAGKNYHDIRALVGEQNLHTVCESAHCPNIGECWNSRTATFMILGDLCTRDCRFCAVKNGTPDGCDYDEPMRIVEAVKKLALKYAVITSVTRDDLDDGGASVFAETIRQIHKKVPGCKVEVLIPDFRGDRAALQLVIDAKPEVINHNLETVPRLYGSARPQAIYARSIELLERAKQASMITKTGLMLGLGENESEIYGVLRDLADIKCDFLTLGQYLQPSAAHLPIDRYVSPEEFSTYKEQALALGFRHVESGPLVRSSYHAASQPFNASD